MKSRKDILVSLAFTVVFVCIINFLAIKGLWYYLFWYFDMPMHFLGGVVVMYLLVYLFYNRISIKKSSNLFYLLVGVLIVGLGWEVFEYFLLNLYAGQPFNIIDSTSDIFFDLAGGILGLLYIRNK
jgi:hypothetical protein